MLLTHELGALPLVIQQQAATHAYQTSELKVWVTRSVLRLWREEYYASIARRAYWVHKTIMETLPKCIGNKSASDPSLQAACGKYLNPERILTPLGVLIMLDVPFSAKELLDVGEDGELVRTYKPDGNQKFIASYSAYFFSQWLIMRWAAEHTKYDDPKLKNYEDYVADAVPDTNGKPYESEDDRKKYGLLGAISHIPGSINDAIKSGDWILAGDAVKQLGFGFNVIEPTPEELQNKGGLYAYYKRGGYLLVASTIDGRRPIHNRKLHFNVGYIKCPDNSLAVVTQDIPDEGHGWDAYVTFKPQAYTIKVRMENRSMWESVKHAVHDVVNKAFDLICKAAPIAKQVAAANMTAKACFLPDHKTPCKEGEANCNCTPGAGAGPPPPEPHMAAVAVGASLVEQLCKGDTTAPIACEQYLPPPPVGFQLTPLMILLGVAAVGAVVLLTRKPKLATTISGARSRAIQGERRRARKV